MAKYLFEVSYGPEGVRGLVSKGAKRRISTMKAVARELGGKLETFYFAFGDVDAFLIMDLPDNAAANAIAIAVNQSGAVSVKTTVLLGADELDEAISRHVSYRAPGE